MRDPMELLVVASSSNRQCCVERAEASASIESSKNAEINDNTLASVQLLDLVLNEQEQNRKPDLKDCAAHFIYIIQISIIY